MDERILKRIKELEQERDRLLETPLEIYSYSKNGKPQTNHKKIRALYNRKIGCLKKYGVENAMDSREFRLKQKENTKRAWTHERKEEASERWKKILTPEKIKERTEKMLEAKRLSGSTKKPKQDKIPKTEVGKMKAMKAYKKYKDEFGDNFISTFDEYYNRVNIQDTKFKCSICGEIYKTSLYSYRNGMTRCKNCRKEYKSNAIKSSETYKEGIKKRDEKRRTIKMETLREIWKDELELLEDLRESKNPEEKVRYRCKRCGHEGKQAICYLTLGLVEGTGCSNQCHREHKGSSYELELYEFFKELGFKEDIDFIRHDRTILKGLNNHPLELDFYFPKYKVAIEFNGLWHHSYNYQIKCGMSKNVARNYHHNKTRQCEEKGIHLIHVWQTEWKTNKDRIKSIIKGELGLTENKIYARKCEIKKVSQEEYKEFVTRLSVLRYRNAKHKWGLYYQGRLVMLMGIDYCQSGKGSVKKDELEIVRSVTELDTIVVGGTSKLLKHIIPILNELYPDIHTLVYFVDYDKHLGKSAIGTGAIFDGYSGFSCQNYCAKTIDLVNKNGQTKHLQSGKVYSRMPAFHREITQAIERDDIYALYTSGTKKFHYNI